MLQPYGSRPASGGPQNCRMVVISRWNSTDKPPGRLAATRELAAVWAVHLHRSYRLIRGA